MDFDLMKANLLAHYIRLASIPGWKEYVWHRVNELAKQHPSQYADLPPRLVEAMRNLASGTQTTSGAAPVSTASVGSSVTDTQSEKPVVSGSRLPDAGR